jgi:Penicillinase repressor
MPPAPIPVRGGSEKAIVKHWIERRVEAVSYPTMQTRLNRLVEKGLVSRSEDRPARYRAAASRDQISVPTSWLGSGASPLPVQGTGAVPLASFQTEGQTHPGSMGSSTDGGRDSGRAQDALAQLELAAIDQGSQSPARLSMDCRRVNGVARGGTSAGTSRCGIGPTAGSCFTKGFMGEAA